MNQKSLNKYFANTWKSNLDRYQYSGWALADKIQSNESVLVVDSMNSKLAYLI